VRLNVGLANLNLTWIETRIYAISSGCASLGEVGVATGSISLGLTGVKTMTVSGAALSPGADATYYVQIIVSNASAMNQACALTFNQDLDSPLDVAGQRMKVGVGL